MSKKGISYKVIFRIGAGIRYFKTKKEVMDYIERNRFSKYELYIERYYRR